MIYVTYIAFVDRWRRLTAKTKQYGRIPVLAGSRTRRGSRPPGVRSIPAPARETILRRQTGAPIGQRQQAPDPGSFSFQGLAKPRMAKPESTEAMGRGDDTKDDGQGKANGPGLIPIEGMRAA